MSVLGDIKEVLDNSAAVGVAPIAGEHLFLEHTNDGTELTTSNVHLLFVRESDDADIASHNFVAVVPSDIGVESEYLGEAGATVTAQIQAAVIEEDDTDGIVLARAKQRANEVHKAMSAIPANAVYTGSEIVVENDPDFHVVIIRTYTVSARDQIVDGMTN